jgi:hypothetical protein
LIIINIYAVRSSNERAPKWKRLSEAGFIVDHVILGDFNHFEKTNHRGITENAKCPEEKQPHGHT